MSLSWTIGPTGISVPTQAQLLTYFQQQFLTIYGTDLTLQDSSSPDNQWVNNIVQIILDLQDFNIQNYNFFDPDNAIGITLDERVAINGIQRIAATYSTTDITVVVSQALTLYGLDQTAQPVYTVSDSSGNQWQLQNTQSIEASGTFIYVFQAANPGAVLTTPNTITNQVTIVIGVTSVNNPSAQLVVGTNEESDGALKIRRQKSVSISSQGYYNGLLAALENVPGLTFAYVEENDTGTTNGDGVPGHSIWVIVAGSGASSAIAQAIYTKRNAGCGMYGGISYPVVQADGSSFLVYWDVVAAVPLFIKFTANSLDGVTPPDIARITANLPTTLIPGVAAQVNINELGTAVQSIDPNTMVTGGGYSIAATQVITFSGVAASGTFKLSYGGSNTAAINWNDTTQIQTKLRALTGLGSVVVTGSIASQSLSIAMTGVTNPTLIGYNTNSLETSGSAAITLGFLSNFTFTLTPALKLNQFQVTSPNVVITPMIMNAPGVAYSITSGLVTGTTVTVADSGTLQFTGLGGYGALSYACTSSTGGTITSGGLYTAGTTGTDTVTVTDVLGNSSACTITVP